MDTLTTFYEVYDKRALHEPLSTLPLLDRDTNILKAQCSARVWGGVVVRVEARVLAVHPLQRTVLASEVVFIHSPKPPRLDRRDRISIRELRGQIRRFKHRRPPRSLR